MTIVKLNQLVNPNSGVNFKEFKLKGGKQTYTAAHMNGDRKRVCVSRQNGKNTVKRYIDPHKEVEIIQ